MITLDNSRNAAPATWQVSITQKDPQGNIWATASPTSGTLPAGQTATVTVTPLAALCQELQRGGQPVPFSLAVLFTIQGGPAQQVTITDSVTPPV